MDDNNPANTPPASSDEKPATTADNDGGQGSPAPVEDKQAEAYRKMQSEKDKTAAENGDLRETVEFLQQEAAERMKNKAIGDFLKENAEKYPDVTAEDLQFATSEEDLERIATHWQTKAAKQRQQVLADVRQVPDNSITETEKQKELDKLKTSNSPNRFLDYLRLEARPIKK